MFLSFSLFSRSRGSERGERKIGEKEERERGKKVTTREDADESGK